MKKIMLVEDDPVMINLLSTLLEIEGYEVASIDLSMDIMRSIADTGPDVIILDVHLRDPNGLEINGLSVLEQIRNLDQLKNCRVVVSSGIDFKEKSIESGADGFILKPYMPDKLIELIKQVSEH